MPSRLAVVNIQLVNCSPEVTQNTAAQCHLLQTQIFIDSLAA